MHNRALLLVFTVAISASAWPAMAIDGTAAHTLRSGDLTRSYLLQVPVGLPAGPAPLVLVFHGGGGTPAEAERDTRFSELADRGRFLGCAGSPREERLPDRDPHDGYRATRLTFGGGRNGTSVVLYRLEGGGHTWPGSAPRLPRCVVGGVCRDIDGSEVIWEFFRDHPKTGRDSRLASQSVQTGRWQT